MMTTISSQSSTGQITLKITAVLLALIYFFVPAGRFQGSLYGISFSTGYDAFKLIPIPFITWFVWWKRHDRETSARSSLYLPFAVILIVTLISGIASSDEWQALADSLEILLYFSLLLLLTRIPWTHSLARIPAAGFVIGNLYLGSVILRQFLATKNVDSLVRLSGTFTHPNTLGAYAILGFTLLIWLTRQTRNKAYLFWTWIAAIMLLFSLLTTQSRTALIALAVWGITAAGMGTPQMRKYTIVLFALALVVILFFAPQIALRFYALSDETPDPSRINRPLIWSQYLTHEIPQLSPFGVGMGPVSTNRFGDWIASNPGAPSFTRAWGPHNTYLAWMIGAGFMGLFCLLWLFKTAWDRIQNCDPFSRTVLSAGLLSFAVTCLFQDPFLVSNIPIAWITLIAIGDRLSQNSGREELS